MSLTEILYDVSDLNDDNITITAKSSDETIVAVDVDTNNKKIKLYAQPKVGSTAITITANDGKLDSNIVTITVTTINTMETLVKELRVVPVIDSNENIQDNRFEFHNFKAQYNIASNEITISGDINSTYNFNEFVLEADSQEAMFGGTDSGKTYGLVIKMDITQEGQNFKARVLAFSKNEKTFTPYLWALATEEEICSANFSDSFIQKLNTYNTNSINCEGE
jgi:hypothetical protein